MALHLEDAGQAVAEVDDAVILPRTDQALRPPGGEGSQVDLAGLVGAVLGPHGCEQGELGGVGLASQLLDDGRELLVGEGEPAVERLLDLILWGRGHAVTRSRAAARSQWNTACPPVGPRSGSTACSGWGIIPSTFPASLRSPAMPFALPLGLN